MSLKDLTWEHHKEAERQQFVKVLMSGNINPELYATYLWNQHKRYDLLEAIATPLGLIDQDLFAIRRKDRIEKDFLELWKKDQPPKIVKATEEYIMHMKTIMADPEKVMAHLYVLHMGDLSGGQMIKRKVPGEGRMYQFDKDKNELKESIRAKIHDGMAEEAKFVFSNSTDLFKNIMELDIEHYMEPVS
jgi:heme oxygenase|tara:strand:- start:8977 stop:9543 length:567 start_codon:yes stop_codon:yes gene_type:complete